MSDQMESVSARFPRSIAKQLSERAAAEETDRSTIVRRLVMQALDEAALADRVSAEMESLEERLSIKVNELRREISKLQEGVATIAVAIIAEVNKLLPEDKRTGTKDLKVWAKKTLLQ